MVQFFESKAGRIYYERTMPQAVREIGRLADNVAVLNEILRPLVAAKAPKPERLRVLLVDDDKRTLRALERLLKPHVDVLLAEAPLQALALLGAHRVDVVISDFEMPGEHDGVWFLKEVRGRFPDARRILTSGANPAQLQQYVEAGVAEQLLPKPAELDRILAALKVVKA